MSNCECSGRHFVNDPDVWAWDCRCGRAWVRRVSDGVWTFIGWHR